MKREGWQSVRFSVQSGGVSEWLKETVLKTVMSERASRVRISPPPPCTELVMPKADQPLAENAVCRKRHRRFESSTFRPHIQVRLGLVTLRVISFWLKNCYVRKGIASSNLAPSARCPSQNQNPCEIKHFRIISSFSAKIDICTIMLSLKKLPSNTISNR